MTYTSSVEANGQLSNSASATSVSTIAIPASARTDAAAQTAAASASAIDAIASDSAKVSLAGTMLSQASMGSDVRFDRIAALQQSIGAGTYGISSAQIADKLVDSLQN